MASTASSYSDIGGRNIKYVGELVNQKRHGYGIYTYANSFFRYEGEWKNGVKHGYGKLMMADGSYYEGQFENGEITGHGFKKFSRNDNCYTGNFVCGEMDGEGVMCYQDNSKYEGLFHRNYRQGKGVLTESKGKVYQGFFYKDKRHSNGCQIYSDGSKYEGEWVKGQRQGHGEYYFSDGSIYTGQWKNDKFNGEGTLNHVSGASYSGLWGNGVALNRAVRVKLMGSPLIEDERLVVEQGEFFSLNLQLVDENGDEIGESGRKFQVLAGHRSGFNQVKSFNKSSLLEMIEVHDRNNHFIPTPFGYSVKEYPLTEIPEDLIEDFVHFAKTNKRCNDVYEVNSKLTQASDDESVFMKQADSNRDLLSVKNENFLKSATNIDKTEASRLKAAYEDGERPQSTGARRRKVEDFIRNFQPCRLQTSDSNGSFDFDNLYLLKPSEAFEDALTSFDQEKTEKELDVPLEEYESVTNTIKKTNKSHKSEFVLVIKEVTNPPFLDKLLPPIYLQIHLKQPDIPKINDSL